jgi:hypothetical protein
VANTAASGKNRRKPANVNSSLRLLLGIPGVRSLGSELRAGLRQTGVGGGNARLVFELLQHARAALGERRKADPLRVGMCAGARSASRGAATLRDYLPCASQYASASASITANRE